ncbi:uncharacterized protein J4E88_000606 [Alternaria novae-zelandiae]|uniref:uncharacterized protein n=1 Tax=Alternaria metachromatica TaxID=283354 RepID=UPI0020C489D1|nr:uncharacterized protein J4E83_003452 [Alternaria metachromatica]XP_049208465.1 uncharacterized protein J4E79_008242 [Alternaria viburni]XP_049224761.1 uncharacterized protein J4E78_003456 [Alternaria triticimaculans]XP_049260109.1 uncharacterized protein J4E88_000606 [Alternaria novae-zelandiae]XP_051328480.1 uncharacterized protein J4E85_003048 [Alternaria conjuncta]XP_051356350.1 uncharacterized protein J4E92_001708 [Alternaria infectoria]KAI4630807.1 hypothetical protein J4E80_001745 [A
MQFLYALLPLLPLAAANGRIRFNSFDHPGCQGFEENYDLNPAVVKGNFPGPRGSIQMLVTSPGCHLTLYTGPNQSQTNGGNLRIDTGVAACFSNPNGFEDYLSFGYYCD